MEALISILAAFSILALLYGVYLLAQPQTRRLALQRASGGTELETPRKSRFERSIRPIIIKLPERLSLLRWLMKEQEINKKLQYAGFPLDMDAQQFFGLKLLSSLAFGIAALYYAILGYGGAPIMVLLSAVGGFFLPDLWLNQKISDRQTEISLSLPDFLDSLSACVQAGMGFDVALDNLIERVEGPLRDEIARLLRELKMGVARKEAFKRLGERNRSEELRDFVAALTQAEDLGVPISKTLAIQAENMRTHRSHRAKELGAKASPRITMVAIFLIAPSAVLLLAGAIVLWMLQGGGLAGFG